MIGFRVDDGGGVRNSIILVDFIELRRCALSGRAINLIFGEIASRRISR